MLKYLLLAVLSMVFWASSALILLGLSEMPAFFLEAIIMLGGGAILMLVAKDKYINSFSFWGVLGVAGNHLSYILSLRLIPAPALDIIYCTWPVLIFFMSHKRPMGPNLICGLLSIAIGLAILIWHYKFVYSVKFFFGCIIGFLGPLLWALYNVKLDHSSNNCFTIGLYLVLGGIVAAFISCLLSEQHSFSQASFIGCLLLVIGPCSLAYLFWDKAITELGYMISFIGYLVPFASYLLLVINGVVAFDYVILLGMTAMLISSNLVIAESE